MFRVYTVDVRDQTIVIQAEFTDRLKAQKNLTLLNSRIRGKRLNRSLKAEIFSTEIHDEKEFVSFVAWLTGLDTWDGRKYDWKIVEKHPLVEVKL